MRIVAASLGSAKPCGPACYHYCASEPLLDGASLFLSVPNIVPNQISVDQLEKSIKLIQSIRQLDNCHVTLVADRLDDQPKQEWSALLRATHIWSVKSAQSYLETRVLVSENEAKPLWSGTFKVSGATVPGFRLSATSNAGDDIRELVSISCTEARLVAVLPNALAIGAILNSRNEMELRVNSECTTATSYLCNGWAEVGCSFLFSIGESKHIARVRTNTPFIADVAPVRELSSQLIQALDMCSFRRDKLGVVGRSRLCIPHSDFARLPVLDMRDGKLEVSKSTDPKQPWIDSDQFESALSRLGAQADPNKPGIRPPMHRSEISKLERNTLKRRYGQRKRPRQANSPLRAEENVDPRLPVEQTNNNFANNADHTSPVKVARSQSAMAENIPKQQQPPLRRSTSQTPQSRITSSPERIDQEQVAVYNDLKKIPVSVNKDSMGEKLTTLTEEAVQRVNQPGKDLGVHIPAHRTNFVTVAIGNTKPCGPECYHHRSSEPLPNNASLFVSVPNIAPQHIPINELETSINLIRNIRGLNDCDITLVADSLDDRPRREWSALLKALHFWTVGTAQAYLETRALVSEGKSKSIWSGTLKVSGATVPGFRLNAIPNASDDIHELVAGSSTDGRLLAVLPSALAIGAILNSRNEMELRVNSECTTATSYLCNGWAETGCSFLLEIRRSRLIARVRRSVPFLADVAPVRELSSQLVEALDMCAFRRERLGIVGRSKLFYPHPDVGRLPILEVCDGKLQQAKSVDSKEPWIDPEQFEHAVNRLGVLADPKKPGLRPPMHRSEVSKLERIALKRRYGQQKRPRQTIVSVSTDENTGQRLSAREKCDSIINASRTSSVKNVGHTPTTKAINPTNQQQPLLQRSYSQTPGSATPRTGRGTPGTRNLSGSISVHGIMTTRSAAFSDDLLRTASDAGVGGKSLAAMRMDRRFRLQRQLAARTAAATHRTAARKSMDLERSKSLRRKQPDSCYRRALESCHRFLDYDATAKVRLEDVEFLKLPEEKSNCFIAHGVEFAQMERDRRDEVLQRYEKEVGRTEQEHASAWGALGRSSVLAKIDSVGSKLTTPVGEVFRYLVDKSKRRTSMPILRRKLSVSHSKSTTISTSKKNSQPSVLSASRWKSELACRQTRRSLELARAAATSKRSDIGRRSSIS